MTGLRGLEWEGARPPLPLPRLASLLCFSPHLQVHVPCLIESPHPGSLRIELSPRSLSQLGSSCATPLHRL